MNSFWPAINRCLTWFHRWAGVALCLLFAMWFASGAVLHFVGFPTLPTQDRHHDSANIDLTQVVLPPEAALTRISDARDLRLVNRNGHAAYLLLSISGSWAAVDAASGSVMPDLSIADAQAIAKSFGTSPIAYAIGPVSYDQWIVHQHFDPFRPFYRVRLGDAQKTDLYVSARTGEVLQRTRFSERAWNWAGAVVHWIYFTPLRQRWTAWNQVVWWISLLAFLSSAAGTWLGIVRMLANRAAGRRGLTPFRGWMRWHHLIGLFASVIVITWILSGWLSMDHGRIFSLGQATDDQVARLSGMSLPEMLEGVTQQTLLRLSPATEITFNAIDHRSVVTAYESHTGVRRVAFLNDVGHVLPYIPESIVFAGVKNVWADAIAVTSQTGVDNLYRHAESAGDDAVGFVAGTNGSLRAYIDRLTGRFVVVMDNSRRGYAWIYYGLHTFEFPGLLERPALRTSVVLFLLALGFASSATGIVLSVKRLKRDFA